MCAHEKDFVHFAAHRSLNQGAKTAGGLNLLFLAIVSSEPENGFVTISPAAKDLFPADLTEQRKKLIATLAIVVNRLSNLICSRSWRRPLLQNVTSTMARSPSITRWWAPPFCTLEEGLGSAWTPEVASARTAAYGTLSDLMTEEISNMSSQRPLPRKNESGSGTSSRQLITGLICMRERSTPPAASPVASSRLRRGFRLRPSCNALSLQSFHHLLHISYHFVDEPKPVYDLVSWL